MNDSVKSDGTKIETYGEAFDRKKKLEGLQGVLSSGDYSGLKLTNYEALKKEVDGELGKVKRICSKYRNRLS